MVPKLLDFLGLVRCSHEFSWPRRWPDGDFYQVCLVCGDEYRYDWNSMRRTERVVPPPSTEAPSGRQVRPCSKKKLRWTPRARRIKLQDQQMQFREKGAETWYEGQMENISSSGVLFRTEHPLPENTEVEMILEMPAEICGQKNSRVICNGLVVRFVQPTVPGDLPALATGIWDYKFLHDQDQLALEHVM